MIGAKPAKSSESTKRTRRTTDKRELADATVIPILSKMLRHAEDGSSAAAFAKLHLAEALVDQKPWQASLHARSVLQDNPNESRAWAVLALGQTHLGNFDYAIRAYTRALELCPDNPAYAHNLGHLLDIAKDQPEAALPYLEAAYAASLGCTDIMVSLLHALARTGRVERALGLIASSAPHGATQTRLRRLVHQVAAQYTDLRVVSDEHERPRRRPPGEPRLLSVLEQGLRHLPFGDYEVEAAFTLAAEVLSHDDSEHERDLRLTAAAIAWRVVRDTHLPLGAAEIAAPFRVSLAAMRKRHAALSAAIP